MDKRQTIAHLAQDKEEAMVLSQICERLEAAQQRNIPYFSAFLTAREQMLVGQLFPKQPPLFFGGCDGAERRICCCLPDYLDEEFLRSEDAPVCAVHGTFFESGALSHRDILGALMGAGLKRSCVGDIFVQSSSCDFLLLRELLPFVLENFSSAGRVKLHLTELPLTELTPPQAKVRTVRDTVPSLRLDCVVSAGFSISRAKAAEGIAAGRVELDHTLCTKSDKVVCEGAVISVRGLGKMRLLSVDGTTRKGRIGITAERYL